MGVKSWVVSSRRRLFPASTCDDSAAPLLLEAAIGEACSFQVAVRSDDELPRKVAVHVEAPAGCTVRVRRVGFVPVRHHNTETPATSEDLDGIGHIPGYAPDPLFDDQSVILPQGETHSFWVSVRTETESSPGRLSLRATVEVDGKRSADHDVVLRVRNLHLEARRGFSITHWFYADALLDWYRCLPFDENFWRVCSRYIENYAGHGLDTLYVPAFTPPLDGVKRATQLLRVTSQGDDAYRFDWSDVRRWIDTAQKHGISLFEWVHPFTQWGARFAPRVYEGQGADEQLLWPAETEATSIHYRAFLRQYLSELRRFLDENGILDRSFFHVSDEPHGEKDVEHYRRARAMLSELAPWMKVMDALSEIEYARQGLTDVPVPSIKTAKNFVEEGFACWCYYCCGPRGAYLNRLLDTPLPKIAMHGILLYRWPVLGFLHWGYNYWYRSQTRELIDPYTVQDGMAWPGWAYGDPFVVYPGPDGPIDSMRWEVFAESLQDYALLQTAGVDREGPVLKDIQSFSDFPKNEPARAAIRSAAFDAACDR